jgi:unsaturated chondroitin disaccharide hydrolase
MKNQFSIIIILLFIQATSFGQHTSQKKLNGSLLQASEQYKQLDKNLAPGLFPRSIDSSGHLVTNKSNWWTSGFFPGSLWYLYEFTNDSSIKNAAIRKTAELRSESLNIGDHDIGFKIWCSYGNQLRITKDSSVIPVIIDAATSLSKRFSPNTGLIRSWGKIGDSSFVVIIDNMMNLELLFEAAKLSGDSLFYKIAVSHADKTLENHFREDGSSYHVVEYNANTGKVKEKRTAQGYANSSAWARGQAWGLYGYTMCYRETHDKKYLDQANKIATFILNNQNLPNDKIPYWDFNAPNIPNALRDASAAAIVASAFCELAAYTDKKDGKLYRATAKQIIEKLSSPAYRNVAGGQQYFLLKHSVGHLPAKSEVDVPLSYADYYYLEAMMRLRK